MKSVELYSNWVFPNSATIRADFEEYKKKEERKWRGRARRIGARFPIFDTIEDFSRALRVAKVVTVTDSLDSRIENRSHTTSLRDLKSLVNSYLMPRDVDRIVDGFKRNAPIPLPLILKGRTGLWIMAGNTRLDAAGILRIKKKALLLDVS